MGKKVAIVQSNYIPWKGYFDLIASVDEFILFDDVQYTKRDWRNRNKIKTPSGLHWITIPVGDCSDRRIRDVVVPDSSWRQEHWKTLQWNYRRAPAYREVEPMFEDLYLAHDEDSLSSINLVFISTVCNFLGIATQISHSREYTLAAGRTQKLLSICEQAGASTYVSGPAAKDYLDEQMFKGSSIGVEWYDYGGYPPYPQLWGAFVHEVSIVDLLFNCGHRAVKYMKMGS